METEIRKYNYINKENNERGNKEGYEMLKLYNVIRVPCLLFY
jgi:hypothetical protein